MLKLYELGVDRVEKNLSLGGEAPGLEEDGLDRKADAALLFLCLTEHSLYGNNPQKMKEILNINSSLLGPLRSLSLQVRCLSSFELLDNLRHDLVHCWSPNI